jgi:hypothetical protein
MAMIGIITAISCMLLGWCLIIHTTTTTQAWTLTQGGVPHHHYLVWRQPYSNNHNHPRQHVGFVHRYATTTTTTTPSINEDDHTNSVTSTCTPPTTRRSFMASSILTGGGGAVLCAVATAAAAIGGTPVAHAVGPIKLTLIPTKYTAVACPPDRPIPGEKAMIGMRGLCVTVEATLPTSLLTKDLEKVGVYGFVTDGESGDSVLANNPDGGTDAGQFAMIESIATQDTQVQFEFIAAVPRDKDLSMYENGIGPLNFTSLRIISYPGGQQFGAISPCEMNEFSEECEAWETIHGPYEKASFMVKSNPRTKGY